MDGEEKARTAPADADTARQPEPPAPFLPASFFSRLVRQPSCITKGVCDNCGRCEH